MKPLQVQAFLVRVNLGRTATIFVVYLLIRVHLWSIHIYIYIYIEREREREREISRREKYTHINIHWLFILSDYKLYLDLLNLLDLLADVE